MMLERDAEVLQAWKQITFLNKPTIDNKSLKHNTIVLITWQNITIFH